MNIKNNFKENKNIISVCLRKHSSSPRKMRIIANLIRNKNIDIAFSILKYSNHKVAYDINKLLSSALSNWELKYKDKNINLSNLYIKTIFVNSGRTIKRFRPAPQGKCNKIRKKFNHLTISITNRDIN